VSEYLSKKAVLEWLDDRRYKSQWIESFRDRLESGAFDADESEGTWKATSEFAFRLNNQLEAEVQRLRTALEEVYEELKTLHFMIDHDDDIFQERKKKYLSIIEYAGQSVAGQALSTTNEPINAEKVERVRYAYTCPNCENLIEPEDASKAGMRCPTCRVKEIVPFTIVINAAKGDGNA
jgi:DNA-directed RNA polymerase subunit RPC12/RpoP